MTDTKHAETPKNSMPVYRITDWAEYFENNRTRGMRVMQWIPVPNKHDGSGLPLGLCCGFCHQRMIGTNGSFNGEVKGLVFICDQCGSRTDISGIKQNDGVSRAGETK